MRKIFAIATALFTSVFLIESCSENRDFQKDDQTIKSVVFSVNDFQETDADAHPLTKTGIKDGGGFIWTENDTVGVYPNSGSQVYFAMESAAGADAAVFNGGGWAFKASAEYYSYYPFIGNIYLDRHKIPVSYAGQKQVSLSNSDHIGSFDYMYTPATTSQNGSLNFNYSHLSCIIRLTLTLPAGNYTKLAITAPSEAFVKSGWFDLQSDSPQIAATEYSRQLVTELEEINITEQTTFKVYVLSAPVRLNGVEVTVSVLNDQKKEFQCKKTPSKDYEAQSIYGLTCSSWTEVPQSMGMIIDGWDDGGSLGGDAE